MGVFEARSPDYVAIEITAGADLVAGQYLAESLLKGFTLVDILTGEKGVLIISCPKVKAVKAVGAIDPGDPIYYHASTSNVSKVSTSGVFVGYAVEAALSADTHVLIKFTGVPGAVPSDDARLVSLSAGTASLNETFLPGTISYTCDVANGVTSVTFTVATANNKASVTGDGEQAVEIGDNTISIVVTAEDGVTTKTYTVVVTRAAS